MSVYAYDGARGVLVITWDTGVGCVASTVAELPGSAYRAEAIHLALCLSELSREAWRTYTHPASAAADLEVKGEGWHRQAEREAFAKVAAAVRNPNLPQGGYLMHAYLHVEEAAHRLGRALRALDNQALTDRVIVDVKAELEAIEQAERGELSGRAKQAVLLTRADVSPLQVKTANDLLCEDPLGFARLLQEVDPTAAAVAAAHWLHAAAEVAADVANCHPTQVVLEADNIEALAVEVPTLVLERLAAGEIPRVVVTDLVKVAMAAAEGKIADHEALVREIENAKEWAQQSGDAELPSGLLPRVTPLDPAHPARSLLGCLVGGIRGSWVLYRESAMNDDDDAIETDGPHDSEELLASLDADFCDTVRAAAKAHEERLFR